MKLRILSAIIYASTTFALEGFFDGFYGGEPITHPGGLIYAAYVATLGACLFAIATVLSLFSVRLGLIFGDGNSLLRGSAVDLAEEGGYILVGPMGYNPQGWFGSPVIVMNGGPGRGKGPGAGKGGPPPTPEPPNLAELSEKDVMDVLALVRREFTVDEKRTYLMGHSMAARKLETRKGRDAVAACTW